MKDELTSTIAARIPLSLLSDIHQELKESGKKMNQFLTEAVQEKLSNDNAEVLDLEIQKMEKELEVRKNKKDLIGQKKKSIDEIPEHEISFLLETKKIIDRDPTFIKGRVNLYKNKFGKHFRISEQDFLTLLDNAEAQARTKELYPEVTTK